MFAPQVSQYGDFGSPSLKIAILTFNLIFFAKVCSPYLTFAKGIKLRDQNCYFQNRWIVKLERSKVHFNLIFII